MRILLLSHAFNALTQRLFVELRGLGHVVSVELDISDTITQEAVRLFVPDLIIAPYLRRAIPDSVWSRVTCMVVHPGVIGDRGPSALDWALLRGETSWGVTVLQANAEKDAGPVWASQSFAVRKGATKASLYRREVTEAASVAVVRAVARFERGGRPRPLSGFTSTSVRWYPQMRQTDRVIDWYTDSTERVLQKVRSADSFPGVLDRWCGHELFVYDAWPEDSIRGRPGDVLGWRDDAVLRATRDGAVWIGQMRSPGGIKLPARLCSGSNFDQFPELPLQSWWRQEHSTWQDIAYHEEDEVGYLRFNFYSGAMATRQCQRLTQALRWARERPVRVLVLQGGDEFWSNGIHLGYIEAVGLAGGSAADASWDNIQAMDDVAETILTNTDQLTVAAVAGNAGAGGCFLARAAEYVWLRKGVLLNPHYKNMGNLYGSEYWTYTLPRRVGEEQSQRIIQDRLPMGAEAALACGLADACLEADSVVFKGQVDAMAQRLAQEPAWSQTMQQRRAQRLRDEVRKPLVQYRSEELDHMRRNFFGFDTSYHIARHHFVHKSPASWTPRHLALHRQPGWKVVS